MHGDGPEAVALGQEQHSELGSADSHRFFQHGVEDRLQLAGRGADNLEHVGGGGLLLQRFAQLAEQPRVLDGDDGLSGEVLHQLDLLVGERTHLLAVNDKCANEFVFPKHWDNQCSSHSSQINCRYTTRVPFCVSATFNNIADVNGLLCTD